ncbi:peptide ABC transporter substrate-binding protein [Bacillus carboniphilus]|uniref:Peptide ABC transporter substrate-binding protein n=1 Tax=Bacillus carboniphilus TaxID=86663 RepID=A0ABY9JZ81_9BACI|nr:peptide ABC transporter substrate-binding protein [Bacillus carboniphilus]WLR42946.1 peptide ABC transporter substrate-binding protein [Bacillus carboniphilus]
MLKNKFSVFLILSLVLSLVLTACSGGSDNAEGDKDEEKDTTESVEQVLNTLESAEIPTMDTVMGTDAVSFNVMNQVFEGLYRLGENDEVVEGLAEGEPEISEDGKTYTIKLRDAEWSNGDPVVAEDFVYAWQRAVNPKTGSEYGPYMMGGKILNATEIAADEKDPSELGIKALDEKTLEIQLVKPLPYFESLMTFATFLPQNKSYVEEQGDDYAKTSDNLVYNGPFVLTDWDGTTATSWNMEKSDTYWDKDAVSLEKVTVKVVKEPSTSVNLYETGEVDTIALSSDFVDKYTDHEDLMQYGEPVIFWLKLNQENEILANKNIRMALNYAIDKQGLTDGILKNGSIPAYFAVPKNFVSNPDTGADFREANGDFLGYDVDKAKEYWEKGLDELGMEEVTLEILGGDTETSKKSDAYLKNQLETVLEGLTIDLAPVPFSVRIERDKEMDYQIQVAGWGPDYKDPMTFSDLWVTDGGHNFMAYSNSEYDKLIEEANTTLAQKPVERFEALQEAERILLEEDAAIVPLYQRGISRLTQPYVKDRYIHTFGPDFSFKWTKIEK